VNVARHRALGRLRRPTVADFDLDGATDLGAGAFLSEDYLVLPGVLAPTDAICDIESGSLWSLIGVSAAAGDLDADGRPDLVIGDPMQDDSGLVYVFLGEASDRARGPARRGGASPGSRASRRRCLTKGAPAAVDRAGGTPGSRSGARSCGARAGGCTMTASRSPDPRSRPWGVDVLGWGAVAALAGNAGEPLLPTRGCERADPAWAETARRRAEDEWRAVGFPEGTVALGISEVQFCCGAVKASPVDAEAAVGASSGLTGASGWPSTGSSAGPSAHGATSGATSGGVGRRRRPPAGSRAG
jgi:hypothetical protein